MTDAVGPLSHGRRGRRVGGSRVVLLTLGGLAVVVALAAVAVAGFLWHVLAPVRFSTAAAAAIAAQVVNHTLVPAAGVVTPASTWGVTCDGPAYVTVDRAGTTWVLFPTWRGKGSNVIAHVYRSTPATGPAPAEVNLTGPGPPSHGPCPYVAQSQDGPNWYTVNWDLD